MKRQVTFGGRSVAGIAAVLAIVSITSCRGLEAPDRTKTGNVTVLVVDQANAAIGGSLVTLEVGPSNPPNTTTRTTNDQGLVAYELVPAGQSTIVFAEPPIGYSGGGRPNATNVLVTEGQNVDVKITLTKTAVQSSR